MRRAQRLGGYPSRLTPARAVVLVVAALVVAVTATGCGDDAKTPEAAAIDRANRSTVPVTVSTTGFDPAELTVRHGDNVAFAMTDAVRLTGVQDGTTVFDSGAQRAGDTFTWRPGGVGTVTVTAEGGSASVTAVVTVTAAPG
jgi:hypothetical protein